MVRLFGGRYGFNGGTETDLLNSCIGHVLPHNRLPVFFLHKQNN